MSTQRQPANISFNAKVDFLKRPAAYPDSPAQVVAIETHMSWVFLTEGYAYKLKKPVRYPYLDFSTLEARRLDSEAEVRLNSRLAPAVYLGVTPLVCDRDCKLSLGGPGQVVDWLVKMLRLPAERMLDQLILNASVGEAEIRGLAHYLARFYASATKHVVTAEAYRQHLGHGIAANLEALDKPEFRFDHQLLEGLRRAQLAFLEMHKELFEARTIDGRIVEGHGDLRPEHVCLLAEPVVIDCLEFNQEFRMLDPVDELGYLALECERLGAPEVGSWLLDTYAEYSGDRPPPTLVHFYQSCRAVMRAKLSIWHLHDDDRHEPDKWIAAAKGYLELAKRHVEQLGA
jgi:aminoglycoside phosphotransferase family enzyme